MKILIIADEEWNDYVYGNNVLTNWFGGFDAEFAEVYCSPGLPNNHVCESYFQITDKQMLKSLVSKSKAGGRVYLPQGEEQVSLSKKNVQREGIYGLMKKVSTKVHTLVMLLRDFIWCHGRYDEKALAAFVGEFNPDIVFCPRYITPKLMRLEKTVATMTNAPFVALTADDEVSLKQVSYSPLYWIRRLWIRKKFKKHVGLYKHYFTFSKDQAEEYRREYGVNTSVLYKCGDFDYPNKPKPVNNPIRMVYAGRLYCKRWMTLAKIGEALNLLNKDGVKAVLDIYSQGKLSKKQIRAFSVSDYISFKGAVCSKELSEIYKKADIALHVESFEKRYKYATRVSFSTKIIDLMASTCAIMAVCWDQHAGYQYLKENDAAFCVSDYDDLLPAIQSFVNDTSQITMMQERAWQCGMSHHRKSQIHQQIFNLFNSVINEH